MRHTPFTPVLLTLAVAGTFTSCRKDPALPVEVRPVIRLTVDPLWNGAPFNKDSAYVTAGGQRVQVDLLKFYLSDLALTTSGSTERLFAADLFNITDGPEQRWLTAEAGTWSGVRFGLGLPYELNHRDLATIPPNDPLGNNSGMYWDWALMYKFAIFDGRFNNDVGSPSLPFLFSFHTGLDTCYRVRSFTLPLRTGSGDTLRLTLNVDLARFFTDGNQVLDLSQGAIWHGEPDLLPLALKVVDLQAAAISVDTE
jgi:hypothetical protein